MDEVAESITFAKSLSVFGFIRYMTHLLIQNSPHCLLAYTDCFVRGVVYNDKRHKSKGILLLPDQQYFMRAWGALLADSSLTSDQVKLARKCDNSTKRGAALKELNEAHSLSYNTEDGESPYGAVPPGRMTRFDVSTHPFITMNRWWSGNAIFAATTHQGIRYGKTRSRYFSATGVPVSSGKKIGRATSLPNPATWCADMGKDILFDSFDEAAKYARTLHFRFRLAHLTDNGIGLTTERLEFYRTKFSGIDISEVRGAVRQEVNRQVAPLKEEVSINTRKTTLNAQNISQQDSEIQILSMKNDIREKENIVLASGLVATNPNLAVQNPGILTMATDSKSMIETTQNIISDKKVLNTAITNLKSGYRFKPLNLGNAFRGEQVKPLLSISPGTLKSADQITPIRPIANVDGAPVVIAQNDTQHEDVTGKDRFDESRGKVRSDSNGLDEYPSSPLFSSDDEKSENDIIFRSGLGCLNLPFTKPLGLAFRANFSERRSAFRRKWAYELRLTPYYKSKFEMIILLYYNELIKLLLFLHKAKPEFQVIKDLKSEATLILEELEYINYGPYFFSSYLNTECGNFDTPSITIQMLNWIFEVFSSKNILIPYVGIKQRKSFLIEFFNNLDPEKLIGSTDLTSMSSEFSVSNLNLSSSSELELPRVFRMQSKNCKEDQLSKNQNDYEAQVLSPAKSQTGWTPNEVTVLDATTRFDADDALNRATSNINCSSRFSNVHQNDTEKVKAYSRLCGCDYCVGVRKINAPLDPSEYLLPPPENIFKQLCLRNRRDKRYNYYMQNRIVPSINDPLFYDLAPSNAIQRARKKLSKKQNSARITLNKIKQVTGPQPKENLKILYTNLDNPLVQLPVLMRNNRYTCDIVCIVELMMNPLQLKQKVSFDNNWDVFCHEPILVSNSRTKTQKILSAILVNRNSCLVSKQIKVPAPATSVCIKSIFQDHVYSLNVTTVYRTHFDSHNLNTSLGIYSKSDSGASKRAKHNDFYFNLFREITTVIQLKVPSILTGDFNLGWYRPRPQDPKGLCRMLRSLFGRYKNYATNFTHFTHCRKDGKRTLRKSRIDGFLATINGTFIQDPGAACLNNGHDLLILRTSIPLIKQSTFVTKTVTVYADPSVIFAQARKSLELNRNELNRLHSLVLHKVRSGKQYTTTNEFTDYFVQLLEEIVKSTSSKKTIRINLSDASKDPSEYSMKVRKDISQLHFQSNFRELSDREITRLIGLSKVLEMSVKEDHRKVFRKLGMSDSQLGQNDIYALHRKINSKSKLAAGKTGNHTAEALVDYYVKTVHAADAITVDPNYDIWTDSVKKLNISDFVFDWNGPSRATSLKQCLRDCKEFTKGKNSLVTRHILAKFPAEFSEFFCKLQECNIKSGFAPDYVRDTRIVDIPKLSYEDLSVLEARRYLAIQPVYGSTGGKHVSDTLCCWLEDTGGYKDFQNAFRKGRSCSTAIGTFILKMSKAKKKYSKIGIFLDSKNAFGSVKPVLINRIISKIADGSVKNYLQSLMLGKSVCMLKNDILSKPVKLKDSVPGVPQGGAESPTLFSLLLMELDKLFPKNTNRFLIAYADDLCILIAKPTTDEAVESAKEIIKQVEEYMRNIGVKTNLSKSNFMIFGKDSKKSVDFEIDGEKLKQVTVNRYLGMRFDSNLSIEPQITHLVEKCFPKNRGVIGAVMFSKNRVNLLNLHSSLYNGQFSFSVEVWPRLTPAQGNRIGREMLKSILDIYGIPQRQENGKHHNVADIFSMAGCMSPINIQERAICNFANSIIANPKNPPKDLREELDLLLSFTFNNKNKFKWAFCGDYVKLALDSVKLIKCNVQKPFDYSNIFPDTLRAPFGSLPSHIQCHFGRTDFKRVCKVWYKYKCPHLQGKNPNQCKHCNERNYSIYRSRQNFDNRFQHFSVLNFYQTARSSQIVSLDRIISHVNQAITKGVLSTLPFFESLHNRT